MITFRLNCDATMIRTSMRRRGCSRSRLTSYREAYINRGFKGQERCMAQVAERRLGNSMYVEMSIVKFIFISVITLIRNTATRSHEESTQVELFLWEAVNVKRPANHP
ncbi:unnamed protein product [Ceratitis capitata]|uniref:(Mediterranean fruit fly) hypothetical protein n=1 Tax=Ceratitis capitata TaxID=7213 RepID=A0A811U376_CERCA|nr:unnamed protein product [Ceratitis capitata]